MGIEVSKANIYQANWLVHGQCTRGVEVIKKAETAQQTKHFGFRFIVNPFTQFPSASFGKRRGLHCTKCGRTWHRLTHRQKIHVTQNPKSIRKGDEFKGGTAMAPLACIPLQVCTDLRSWRHCGLRIEHHVVICTCWCMWLHEVQRAHACHLPGIPHPHAPFSLREIFFQKIKQIAFSTKKILCVFYVCWKMMGKTKRKEKSMWW